MKGLINTASELIQQSASELIQLVCGALILALLIICMTVLGFADYCIPLIVPRSSAVNVQREKTREMLEIAVAVHKKERIRPDRELQIDV